MIIDGRALAKQKEKEIKARVAQQGFAARLAVIEVGENPVSKNFIRMKREFAQRVGIEVVVHHLSATATLEHLASAIRTESETAQGIIIQLPLPDSLDTDAVLALIPPEKDVDALSPHPLVLSPVVGAVRRVLIEGRVILLDKRVLVIGRGRLVGGPLAQWLVREGALLKIIGDETESVEPFVSEAEIIISGAGSPHLIKPFMVTQGSVLIDCGASEAAGRLIGDADPLCAEKCSLFTPVPGGIGPLTVAMLFENLFALIDLSAHAE